MLPSGGFNGKDGVQRHGKDCGECDEIVHRWKGVPVLPLVDGLWGGKAQKRLKLTDGKTVLTAKGKDVLAGSVHVDHGKLHGEAPFRAGQYADQPGALKL